MEMSLRHFSKLVSPGYRVRVCITPRALLACFLSFTTFLSLGLEIPAATAAADKKPKQDPVLKGLPITELTADEAILHALNRLAYGPRPGDIERIKQIGLAKWIDQQLNPNSINDAALEARLEIYPTLKMRTAQLLAEYPNPKQAAKRELKAQNQNANAPGADPAINSMAQEMDSSSPAAKTADSSDRRLFRRHHVRVCRRRAFPDEAQSAHARRFPKRSPGHGSKRGPQGDFR